MSQRLLLRRHAAYVVAASIVVLAAACDRESPTDVASATPEREGLVRAPSLAVNAAKPSTSTYEVRTDGIDVASGFLGVAEVFCPAGKRALGGGYKIGGGALISGPDVAVYESSPRVTGGTDGWRLEAINRTAETRRFDVWVTCASL